MNQHTITCQPLRLSGRRAIVTGAGSAMGRAIAEHLVKEGATVALVDHDVSGGFDALEAVDALSEDAGVFIQCDFSTEADIEAMVKQAVKSLDGVDILINSVSICEQALAKYDTNLMPASGIGIRALTAVYLCTRHVGRYMQSDSLPGCVVNIGSVTDARGRINIAAGGPALSALRDQSLDAARCLGRFGIAVRTLTTDTPLAEDETVSGNTIQPCTLGAECGPQEVARAVLGVLLAPSTESGELIT